MSEPRVKSLIIAVDFDDTLSLGARHPRMGKPNTPLIEWLKRLQSRRGIKLILWTCRTAKPLEDAVAWCKSHGLIFDAVNDNIPEITNAFGNNCRKIFANIYIDDRACGLNCISALVEGKGGQLNIRK